MSLQSLLHSELILGIAVGAVMGASIAAVWTWRLLRAQYTSVPTSVPPAQALDVECPKRISKSFVQVPISTIIGSESAASELGLVAHQSPRDGDEEDFYDAESCADPREVFDEPGLFVAVVASFEQAAMINEHGRIVNMHKTFFIEGVESCAKLLNEIGGNMGSYLVANTNKFRNSNASPHEQHYREWLMSELPQHQSTGFKCYVDNSAFMANLWTAWLLEFFVEFFALLHSGLETRIAVETAYTKTLRAHHNFIQRAAFVTATKTLPVRSEIMRKLSEHCNGCSEKNALWTLGAFVDIGRPIVCFCMEMDKEISDAMRCELDARKLQKGRH